MFYIPRWHAVPEPVAQQELNIPADHFQSSYFFDPFHDNAASLASTSKNFARHRFAKTEAQSRGNDIEFAKSFWACIAAGPCRMQLRSRQDF